ncbi:hypothetical protein CHU98_g7063 [Xylaria longipes]|nr:hypothetical protein CHU98_g7063 [Xylaria longipes]
MHPRIRIPLRENPLPASTWIKEFESAWARGKVMHMRLSRKLPKHLNRKKTWSVSEENVKYAMEWTNLPEKYTVEVMTARIRCLDLIATRQLHSAIYETIYPGSDQLLNLLRIVKKRQEGLIDDDEARMRLLNRTSPFCRLEFAQTRRVLGLFRAAEVLSLELRVRNVSTALHQMEKAIDEVVRSRRRRQTTNSRKI